jgi:hypothetical protein
MFAKSRLFLVLALPALALAGIAEVRAQQNWSDPATWPDGEVPGAWDAVVISEGMDVVLDVSPPGLRSLTIDGSLTFSNEVDLELVTEWIVLHGELTIGTEANRHTRNATITFTDEVPGENIMAGMGDRGIMISGGTLNLHGARTNAWTKLAETAEAGSTTIEVLNADQWRVGDQIVLASTDFDPRQAERRTIAAINGNRITLDEPLEYMHFGRITFDVDQRGEVGLLTRNIRIQASADAEESYFGGHIMAMPTSQMYVDGVELTRMGQHLTLARYPIHWHLVGDAQGQYIRNSAIHDTFNRCVTVHGTNYLQVENNVTYNNVGHCFFLEDGIERGNEFVRNLAIQTKCHPTRPCEPTNLAAAGEMVSYDDRQDARARGQASEHVLLPSDNTVASFWITNPDNVYRDNVAAGSDQMGFWMSLPEHPNGEFLGTEISLNTWPRRTQMREFRGNVAHSNFDGFMFDRNINADNTFGVTGNMHVPRADPSDPNSEMLDTVFEDLVAYKNRNGGIWARGEVNTFRNLVLADNAMGYTHASGLGGGEPYTSRVLDSLFVGETENVGNPRTPEEIAYGRSFPKPGMPDFPIRGYEYYDLRHDVVNTTFVNYEDNDTRKTGAISYLMFTSFGVSTNNTVENVHFIDAKPVYFPPMERRWGNDNGSSIAWRTAVFRDIDGSLGGPPDSYVLIHDGVNNSIATDEEACEIMPSWNAAVCTGDVGRLNVGGGGGGGGFGGFGGAGAAAEPVILSRNGQEYNLTATNVRAGTEITVTTERPEVSLTLLEMNAGSWVIFELPEFTTAASGTQQNSLDALRAASETSYFKDQDALWVKVVSSGGPGRSPTSVQVSR